MSVVYADDEVVTRCAEEAPVLDLSGRLLDERFRAKLISMDTELAWTLGAAALVLVVGIWVFRRQKTVEVGVKLPGGELNISASSPVEPAPEIDVKRVRSRDGGIAIDNAAAGSVTVEDASARKDVVITISNPKT